jgi:hypothetical protein
MDRRRFVPSGEGLEGRALLSLFGSSFAKNTIKSDQNVPLTFLQKVVRVKHLPFYLYQVDNRRFLPSETVHNLQNDLNAVIGHLHSPPTNAQTGPFNLLLRDAFSHASLSPNLAASLNHAFGTVLVAAGATPAQTIALQSDMNQLAFVDAKGTQPTVLAANDYSLTLQTALAVGRPIKQPVAPILAAKDGVIFNGGREGRTHNHTPTLVGVYNVGAKGNSITDIQIVTANGNVLGTGNIAANTGDYKVKIDTPLPDGTYDLYSRAIDNQGHMSDLSFHFTRLKVFTLGQRQVESTTTVTPPSTNTTSSTTSPSSPLGILPTQ